MSVSVNSTWTHWAIDTDGPLPPQVVVCECGVEFIPPLFMRRCSNCQAERAFEAARPQRKRAAA